MHAKAEEKAFKVYMSEAAKNINYILANTYNGSYMALHFEEVLKPKQEETRTAQQIIEDIRNGLKRLG